VDDVIIWVGVWPILAKITWPWAQLLDRCISLNFVLETRLKSESFAPLIGFLAFLFHEVKLLFL